MIKIGDIVELLDPTGFRGNALAQIAEPIPLNPENERDDVLMWCNENGIDQLRELNAGTVICPVDHGIEYNDDVNYILVEKPRMAFMQVLREFWVEEKFTGIAESAKIHSSAKIGNNVSIGEHVVIEKGVTIGDDSRIGHNSVILHDCRLGTKVTVGSQCTIGGIGFGYELNEAGDYEMMPHLGNVIIEDEVEIGNNTCIDRAVMGSTHIGRNVKIDNLVHIAHGVQIGQNALIIANAMVAGSVEIGDDAWVSPSASILNKSKVGASALVGMGAVVIRNVDANSIVAGSPAKEIRKRS